MDEYDFFGKAMIEAHEHREPPCVDIAVWGSHFRAFEIAVEKERVAR